MRSPFLIFSTLFLMAASAADACDDWFLDHIGTVGGTGGVASRHMACDGSRISEILVWDNGHHITGLKVIWSKIDHDGIFIVTKEKKYGTTRSGGIRQIKFKSDELVTALELYPNRKPGSSGRLMQIHLTTSAGRSVSAGPIAGTAAGKKIVDVGTGFPVGVWVRSGTEIDSFGIGFIKQPQMINLDVKTYPTLKDVRPELKNLTPSCVAIRPNEENSVEFGSVQERVATSKWNWKSGIKLGAEAKGKAGVPLVAEGEVSVKSEVSFELGHEWSSNEKKSMGVKIVKKFPASTYDEKLKAGDLDDYTAFDENKRPLLHVLATQHYYEADMTLPFKGNMELVFQDRRTISWPVSGTYTGVSFSSTNLEERFVNICPVNAQS